MYFNQLIKQEIKLLEVKFYLKFLIMIKINNFKILKNIKNGMRMIK